MIKYFSYFKVGLLLFVLASCRDEIADVPCEIVKVENDGNFVVNSYVKDGEIVRSILSSKLKGIENLSPHQIELVRAYLDKYVIKDYVSIGLENNLLEVTYLNKETNEEGNLNRDLANYLSKEKKSK